jgi:pimeloyl-ACP methyl ester carboxylesterase
MLRATPPSGLGATACEARRHALPPAPPRTAAIRVRMIRASTGARPVRLLLLHGLASSARVWRRFVENARPEWEVWEAELPWGPDLRDWSLDSDVTEPARRAIELVDGHVHVVVAHSFGANCLLEALDRVEADPFSGLGLSAAVLVSPFYRQLPGDFDWSTMARYLNWFDAILEEGIRVDPRRSIDPEIQREMALRIRDRVGPYGWVRFFDTYLRTPRLRTDRLRAPCLVVAGERDFAGFPTDAAALAAALPDSRLHLLPGCGHFAMVEQPAELAALVDAFLAEVAPGPAPADERRLR